MKKHLSLFWRGTISVFLALLLVAVPAQQAVYAICSPSATSGNNTITCDGADDTVDGLAGNDNINGGGGNDSLVGGAGNDTLTGGAGNDSLAGGAGNDTYAFDTDSALGTDGVTEASGGGTDRLTFSGSNNDVTVNLATTGNQTVNSNLTLNLTSTQVENITGGNGNDTITGNTLNNSLSGGNGNHVLNGGAGNETLAGGNGNDTLSGGTGNDSLTGNAGNDSLTGDAGNDTYAFNTNTALGTDTVTEASGGGTDVLNFSGSNSVVTVDLSTTGNQTVNSNLTLNLVASQVENVTGGNNGDTVTGNTLNNSLSGGNGNDTLNGAAGNDTLTGGAGNDTLTGGTGNDSYAFDTDSALGTDTVTEASGGGTDTLNFTGSTNAVTVDLATTGNQTVNSNLTLNMTSAQVENVTGGNGNDTITGNTLNNSLSGGNGNDALAGGAGNDTLTGGSGNDSLSGDAGNDVLTGGAGDDTYSFNTNSSLGADTLTEAVGGGTDTLTFTGSTNDVVVNMALTGNQTVNSNLTLNMTSAQVDNVTGGDGNDTLTGNNLNNTITGGDGNDTLDGGAGNDTLTGGAGNDTLKTGSGVDTLDAGAGDDTIVITGTNETGDSADGGTGVNIFRFDVGATGVLSLTSNGEDTLDFSLFGNSVTIDLGNSSQQDVGGGLLLTLNGWFKNVIGSGNDDQITGNDADNNLDGGNGNDTLNGGSGNDTLNGEAGDDQLDGGAGTDSLDGGSEYDTAQNYNAEDTHTNIESGLPTPSPEEQTADKSSNTTDKENSSTIFLIEWGQEFTLPCTTTVVDAVTRDGHWLRFTGLCGYSVVLNHVDVSQLQDGIDSLGTPLGGVSVTLLQQGTIVNEIPFGSKVEFTFEVPAGFEGGAYFSNGDAEWVELPFVMVNDTHASISLQSTGTYAWFAR
ncbi:MAG TPA: M10 family metallopeptidase C-terminal domain-containing protein [Anaerolineales bacterium]|nr:M10 family metallopeptidase C-terminal domain-containing protein [Anaerolineales bacterium]